MKRVLLVVDVQNLFFSCRDQYGRAERVDYGRLLEVAVGGTPKELVTARAYMVTKEHHDDHKFVDVLLRLGYTVRKRGLKRHGSDWDTGIAIEVMRDINDYDVFVIASGDGDFVDLVRELKRAGKEVRVVAFRNGLSVALENVADSVVVLDNVDCLWKGAHA